MTKPPNGSYPFGGFILALPLHDHEKVGDYHDNHDGEHGRN